MKKFLSLLFLLGFMSSAFADEEFYGKIESMPENSFEGEWIIDGKSYQVTSVTEIDGGEKDSGAVEEIEVKKYSFLCSVYKFID